MSTQGLTERARRAIGRARSAREHHLTIAKRFEARAEALDKASDRDWAVCAIKRREWPLDVAKDLLDQGYAIGAVSQRTGWPESMLKKRGY